MRRTAMLLAFFSMVAFHEADAQAFRVKADYGTVRVFQGTKGVRSAVADTATITMGDSILLGAASQVTVSFEENSRMIFKGPGALTMAGDSTCRSMRDSFFSTGTRLPFFPSSPSG